jgi:Hemerythrin HHE cation binding domain
VNGTAGGRAAWREELETLMRRYPGETWSGHANLGELARFWLQRHELFRQLDEVIRSGVETALEEGIDAAVFKPWLSRRLGWSLWQLEQHQQVEDHHYFPLFRRAEPRLAPGFELLEGDHDTLHTAIGGLVERATAVLASEAPSSEAFRSDLARFRDSQIDLGRALIRHLHDEEDLVIPLLLERGEQSLISAA